MKPHPKAQPGRIHFQILMAPGKIQLRMTDRQLLLLVTCHLMSPVPSHMCFSKAVQAKNGMKSLRAKQSLGILFHLKLINSPTTN